MFFLSADIWDMVFTYLSSEQYIHKVRCLNYGPMNYAIQRRTSVFYHATYKTLSRWPSSSKFPPSLLNMEFIYYYPGYYPRYESLDALVIENLPRTLTRLVLHLKGYHTPFCVPQASDIAAQVARLDSILPSLSTLDVFHGRQSTFWAIPSSVTDLYASGSTFDSATALPKSLLHLRARETWIYPASLGQCAANLQTLWGRLDLVNPALPALPSLTSLVLSYTGNYGGIDDLHLRFPNLAKLELSHNGSPSFDKFYHLIDLHADDHALPTTLPPTVTQWTTIRSRNIRLLSYINVNRLRDLPPSLTSLCIYNHPDTHLTGVVDLLPSRLTLLDASQTTLHGSEFGFLPTTLTCLHVPNINITNVEHLKRLSRLRDLGWYGGVLRRKVVELLPKQLDSLTLTHVALVTRDSYKESKYSVYRKNGVSNPQLTALRSLPHVRTLVLKPNRAHRYYAEFSYEIIQLLPASIETLVLFMSAMPLSLFPNPTFSPLSSSTTCESSSSADNRSKNNLQTSFNASSDIFSRFKSLKHLNIQCFKSSDELNYWHLIRAVPEGIRLLYLPPWVWESLHKYNAAEVEYPFCKSLFASNSRVSYDSPLFSCDYESHPDAYREPAGFYERGHNLLF